jgi:hypothetical protein
MARCSMPLNESRGSLVPALQHQVMVAMSDGTSVDEVNEEIIEPAPLDADAKGALWLYAWSLQLRHVQRSEAKRYLAVVEARDLGLELPRGD